MGRAVSVICTMLILATMVYSITPVSAQLLPEVIMTCDDDAEINSGDTKTAIIMCEVENPGMFQEKVEIQVESGELANAAPGSIYVSPGDSVEFQIALRSDEAEEPGEIPVNVTATVTEVNGIPHPLGPSDSEEIIITIIEYQYCGASIGQGGGDFDGGDEISISAAISCNSNREGEVSYQVHLIKKSMGSSSWPNGFENINGNCDVDVGIGDTGGNCNFRVGTPDNLDSDWEGCIVIIEVGEVRPNSCPNSNKVDIKIKKKAAGLGIELGGNESLIEQLGITEEQLPVIGGTIGIILVIFGGFIYYRRKGREYE
jgi:hypothetical protein|tara:strand:- start:228 stop:1172 length:945 start_codon:yes stop_codon:yes gene_type:complete